MITLRAGGGNQDLIARPRRNQTAKEAAIDRSDVSRGFSRIIGLPIIISQYQQIARAQDSMWIEMPLQGVEYFDLFFA
jgi:hypothetical protein